MSEALRLRVRVAADLLPVASAAALGVGVALALAGALAGDLRLTVAGGAAACAGLVAVVAGGWSDGLAFVVVSLPLPALYSSTDLRLAPVALVTAAILLGWAVHRGLSDERLELGHLPRGITFALVLVFVVATLFADDVLVAIRELVNFSILLVFLVAATEVLSRKPSRAGRLVSILVAVAALCGVLATLEMIRVIPGEFPRSETEFNRAALGFGQPNALGFFLAVMMPLAVHRLSTARTHTGKAVAILVASALFLGVLATFSRGSWLALLLGTLPLFFVGEARWALRVWLVTLVASVAVDLLSGGMLRDTVQRTLGDWVLEQRVALMLAGIQMFLANPVIGVGPGGYAENLDLFGAQITQLWDYQPTPHNAFVQMAAEAGAIGLVVLVIFLAIGLAVAIRGARALSRGHDVSSLERSLRRSVLWSFSTACVLCLFMWPFTHGPGQALVLIAALSFAVNARAPDGSGGVAP